MRELIAALPLIFMPPCERPPLEYQGAEPITVEVTFASPEWVNAECRKRVGREPGPGMVFAACAGVGRRWAILPDGCLFADGYARVVCHETSHTRGWFHG